MEELNKIAEHYTSDHAPDYPDIDWDTCYEKMEGSFKAGAKYGYDEAVRKVLDWLSRNADSYSVSESSFDFHGEEMIEDLRKEM